MMDPNVYYINYVSLEKEKNGPRHFVTSQKKGHTPTNILALNLLFIF